MKLKDIIFLSAAVIFWLYSSYRSYQKQSASKAKPLPDSTLPDPEINIPRPQRIPAIKREEVKRVISVKEKPKSAASRQLPKAVSLESAGEGIYAKAPLFHGKIQTSGDGFDVDNIQSGDQKTKDNSYPISDVIEEIHSGKTDWRKAIILNEIIRPVYF